MKEYNFYYQRRNQKQRILINATSFGKAVMVFNRWFKDATVIGVVRGAE